jgi:5'-deoxynucleotidase YfbR-like HD superfamily hydrolase
MSARAATQTEAATLLPLLLELNDLKRVRAAGRVGTLATRAFRRGWARLVGGEPLGTVALNEAARAVAAARLAAIDAATLRDAGLDDHAIRMVLHRSFAAAADGALDPAFAAALRETLDAAQADETGPTPLFVDRLCEQPRAGATRPGHRRVVLEPTEGHGDHCATVAVYAVLFAPRFDADPAAPFLAGLAHHLHNARLPDAGFAGDEQLGEQLAPIMATFRERALAELPDSLHAPVRAALDLVFRADTPEARAFQAADVFDRVLEMQWHAQSAAFTLDVALHEMDIVHPGPVQAFQQTILREGGLMKDSR